MNQFRSRKWWIAPVLSVIALTMGIGGLFSFAYWQGDLNVEGATDVHATDAPEILQCYNLEEGDLQSERAVLTTENFGRDAVGITRASMMCEQAQKLHPAISKEGRETVTGSMGPHIAECYRLVGGADPDDQVSLYTRNFGEDRVVVRQAVMMCEGARKVHLSQAGDKTRPIGTPGDHVMVCYQIREGDNPQATVVLENRNFGKDKVIVGPAVMMCEEANKRTHNNREGVGRPTGFVWECFGLREGDDPQAKVVLETKNFGEDRVVVRHSRMMCEQAKKDHFSSLDPVDQTR